MKKDSKQRLFEMMGRLGPEFNVSEAMPQDANTDVEMLKNLKSPALDSAREKIHNQQEFNDAFEYWFSTLGVANEYKDRINITTTINHIREVLEKYDVKN